MYQEADSLAERREKFFEIFNSEELFFSFFCQNMAMCGKVCMIAL